MANDAATQGQRCPGASRNIVTISDVTAAGVKLDKSMRFVSKLGCTLSGIAAVLIKNLDLDTASAVTDKRPSNPIDTPKQRSQQK